MKNITLSGKSALYKEVQADPYLHNERSNLLYMFALANEEFISTAEQRAYMHQQYIESSITTIETSRG